MENNEFFYQSKFYNNGYSNNLVPELGIPDLKIVDYKKNIEGKKILNIGGGNSSDLWFLSKNNEIHSIDSSNVGVEMAKKHNVNAIIGDVELMLPYKNNYFDIVVLKDILEHIYSPVDLLSEARRVLNDDGYLIISLPNHFFLPFRLRILFGGNLIWKSMLHNHKKEFEEWNYQHIRFFTFRGVRKMLSISKLKIDKSYWDFGTLAHYSDPIMLENAFKINNKKINTTRSWIIYRIALPVFKIFNFLLPKKIRSIIVSLSPDLLCAGFYIKVKKQKI